MGLAVGLGEGPGLYGIVGQAESQLHHSGEENAVRKETAENTAQPPAGTQRGSMDAALKLSPPSPPY